MLFNLIYKAMKYDRNTTRVIAFAKQVLSTTMHCSPPIVAATVFLINEVTKFHPPLAMCVSTRLGEPNASRILDFRSHIPLEALVLRGEVKGGVKESEKQASTNENDKEPILAPLWDISMLLNHHHPSVSNFTKNLGNLDYAGDPLKDFALPPFLDKFAYRNPKSAERIENKLDKTRKTVTARHSGAASLAERKRALPFNDASFLGRTDVAVQDEFFHHFFLERATREEMKGIQRRQQQKSKPGADGEVDEHGMDDIDANDFFSYEQNWDVDEEEEQFVDELAQKIIDDAVDADELGPGDLDDEDPDTSNWDDLHEHVDDESEQDDDETVDKGVQHETSESESEDHKLGQERDLDDGGDDAEDSMDEPNELEDDDAFMDDDGMSSESNNEFQELEGEQPLGVIGENEAGTDNEEEGPNEKDEGKHYLALIEDDSGMEDSDQEPPASKSKRRRNEKKSKSEPVFASVKDYEEQIITAWDSLKRNKANSEMEAMAPARESKKKPKRRKKR